MARRCRVATKINEPTRATPVIKDVLETVGPFLYQCLISEDGSSLQGTSVDSSMSLVRHLWISDLAASVDDRITLCAASPSLPLAPLLSGASNEAVVGTLSASSVVLWCKSDEFDFVGND
jgi:hypothetical protein